MGGVAWTSGRSYDSGSTATLHTLLPGAGAVVAAALLSGCILLERKRSLSEVALANQGGIHIRTPERCGDPSRLWSATAPGLRRARGLCREIPEKKHDAERRED